jgi:hypothetical protein
MLAQVQQVLVLVQVQVLVCTRCTADNGLAVRTATALRTSALFASTTML